jgi:hypothetical protein
VTEGTRRAVRLFVLLGVVVAVYLVLCLFDRAARADDQVGATHPVASVKAVAASARKAVPEPKSIVPKSSVLKVHSQRIRRTAVKAPEVHLPKVQAPKKIHAPAVRTPVKIRAPKIEVRETVRRVQVRASKVGHDTSAAVKMTLGRTSAVRPNALADLPQAEIPVLPQLPSRPQPAAMPQAQVTAWPQLPAAHRPAPAFARTVALPNQPAAAFAPSAGLSGVAKPSSAQPRPRTSPLPSTPRQPGDRSISTDQARDAGGGSAPATGTVSSLWRPAVAAAGCRLGTDLIARGRTVRYAGPPS